MLLSLLLSTSLSFAASQKTEVQINICETQDQLKDKLQLSDWKKKDPEQSYFVDNQNLSLYKNNWVFKITLTADSTIEVSLKNNKSGPEDKDDGKKCEYDLHGSTRKWACKVTNIVSEKDIQQAEASNNFLLLLNDDQLNWLRDNNVKIPTDAVMTDAFVDQDRTTKLKDLKITLGISKGTRGDEFIELSNRSDDGNEKDYQTKMLKYLKDNNVNVCADQGSIHTRMKLESFFRP